MQTSQVSKFGDYFNFKRDDPDKIYIITEEDTPKLWPSKFDERKRSVGIKFMSQGFKDWEEKLFKKVTEQQWMHQYLTKYKEGSTTLSVRSSLDDI